MQEKHQNIKKYEQENEGFIFNYSFHSITKIQAEKSKDMIIILSTIALAVLFVSILNYILLTLNVLINRAKISAIQKTCGARNKNIQGLIFSETILVFLISITTAFLIILVLKKPAEIQLEHKLNSVLNPIVIWPILIILALIIAASSYLPGRFFSRIPVTSAFNTYKLGKNKWKLVLLSVQFIGASFILSTLVIVNLQYNKMKYADHGYQAKDVYYGSTVGMDGNKLNTVLNELRALPGIKTVGLGCELPINGASGNNIRFVDENKDLFNIADFYEADENYLSILGIKAVDGDNFSSETAAINDVIISNKGADLLNLNSGWKTGVVGKQINVTAHGTAKICGVYPDFIINSIAAPDYRPSAFFYWPEEKFIQEKIHDSSLEFNILIKKHEGSKLDIKKITEIFNLAMPLNDASIKSLEDEQQFKYASEKGFKNAMMAGNIVILLITIIGLLGYTTNEAIRRQKELAIRRINGAKLTDILRVFINDLEYIAIPAVVIGIIIARFTLVRWMENFAYKIPLHWGIFALCSLAIIAMVAIIAAVNYSRTASKNPVETLRYE
jgi:putative ABC transport system permease protein